MITIREGDRQAAFEAPFNVYPDDTLYVPPLWSDFDRMLDPARNPYVTEGHGRFTLFTAHRAGKPVGRIVASIHDASNRLHGTLRGAFGYFDCGDDEEVARALLKAAEDWVVERGMREIAGNFNLTAMQQIGVLTDGFDKAPFTDMMWNPPHIPRLLAVNGYRPSFPMTTFESDLTRTDPASLLGEKQKAILSDPAYSWIQVKRSNIKRSLEDARQLLNDGFAENPMFVPPSSAEYLFQAGDLMWVIDKRISTIIRYKDRLAGAIIAIPDLNPLVRSLRGRFGLKAPFGFVRHKLVNKRAMLIYQSVSRALHNRGLNGAMLYRVLTALKSAGYETLGGTWVGDANPASLREAEKGGARPLHRLHLFAKPLVVKA